MVSNTISYSGGPGFMSQPEDRIKIVVVVLSHSIKNDGIVRYLKLSNYFLAHPSKFIIIHHLIIRFCVKSVVKQIKTK